LQTVSATQNIIRPKMDSQVAHLSSTVARHWRIRGKVQGVGYRAAMVDRANFLGVCGWVRNRADGTVEAMVSGPADAVASLLAWAKQGPAWAEVAGVDDLPGSPCTESFAAKSTA
jgi:acylphosphatase